MYKIVLDNFFNYINIIPTTSLVTVTDLLNIQSKLCI